MLWIYLCSFALISGLLFYFMFIPFGAGADSAEVGSTDLTAKKLLMATAVLVPLVSLVFYHQKGAWGEVLLGESMSALSANLAGSESDAMAAIEDIEQRLESLTQSKPEKPEYWFLLGDLRHQNQDYTGAIAAYERASAQFPDDVSIQARLAEAQFLADNYLLTEAVRGHIDKVLASDPMDTTVLGILGISAFRSGQFEAAIKFWERSLQALPPMSAPAQSIRASIDKAREAAGLSAGGESHPASGDVATADAGSSALAMDVQVSLGQQIQARSDQAVFVFAREYSEEGGGRPSMPVVVERLSVGQLPISLRLDDSKVMIPGRRLADFPQLELVARLSFSGQPVAQKGDYEVRYGPVDPAEIDQVIELNISDLVR